MYLQVFLLMEKKLFLILIEVEEDIYMLLILMEVMLKELVVKVEVIILLFGHQEGDMIAFTKQEGGQFYIGVMEIDGSNERMIAKSFHVEGPTWAPNGRYLMYFKEERTAEDGSGGESSLYSIDLTGYNERKIITPLGGSDPAWSPLMH